MTNYRDWKGDMVGKSEDVDQSKLYESVRYVSEFCSKNTCDCCPLYNKARDMCILYGHPSDWKSHIDIESVTIHKIKTY